MAALMERLSFLQKLPVLMKGTSDDEVPCPGYLFQDIAKISQESEGSSQCLLEYLLNRLQNKSCHVKLKVLKILLYMCVHGSPQFMLELRRNVTFIQEAAVFSGPSDPLHGSSLYQKVRATAQDLASALFSDALLSQSLTPTSRALPQTGSVSESLLSTIQKAAEAMSNAGPPNSLSSKPQEEVYLPVTIPSTGDSCQMPRRTPPLSTQSTRGSYRQPGLAGGGWEENDSGNSSQNSSQETCDLSRTSESCSKCGSDGQSGASREASDPTERVEAINLNDCLQEINLVKVITKGETVFLTREEVQEFVKGCALLNCEAILELLNHSLDDASTCVQMRALCAISSLMCADLLSHDQMFMVIKTSLQQLSQGNPGPVANKATKILRQFEALNRVKLTSESLQCESRSACVSEEDLLTNTYPTAASESVAQPLQSSPFLLSTPELVPSKNSHSELALASPSPWGEPGSEEPQHPATHASCAGPPLTMLAGTEVSRNRTTLTSSDTQTLTLHSGGAQDHSTSLFAGMNLVTLPAARKRHSEATDSELQDRECTDTLNAMQRQPSSFSFLNI
ncbi:AP-4 complex accessory subunit Tepsin isoform X2 [Microcaecilia unicolor]|uniref:AP-4 complex accessory subunit Tepsin n=1 Tax=Microcaecilia unicolor TaxID=1415580 RepID=A0A6P7YAE1_9AMPH|nr:AP-4 complex accessory subunit tepsin isoform X2 [Microcaecilia unicolor]